MSTMSQEERLKEMMKRPIPRKKVSIVHLEVVKESRCLCGMRRFRDPEGVVEMMRPLFQVSPREMMAVVSLNSVLEPQAVEIVAVGGVMGCEVDIRSVFQQALLSNAAYVIGFHNHPSGPASPSMEDRQFTRRLSKAGKILGITLLDHIIIADDFYSFKRQGNGELDAA